jgi:AcrR family transcriptional regulator
MRERTGEPRYHELLNAAAIVFAELGYEKATVAAITAEARVSRATLYVYFASKDDVFIALAARVRDDFLAAQQPASLPSSPHQLLRDTIHAISQAVQAHGHLLRLIDERSTLDPRVATIYREIRDRPIRRFTKFLTQEVTAGRATLRAPAPIIAEALSTALSVGLLTRADTSPRARNTFTHNMITLYEALIDFQER